MNRHGISSAHRRATSLHHRNSHSSHRRHGISNAHAFAVGRSTGVNINGSGMGAHGAALHRSATRRKNRLHKKSTNTHTNTRNNIVVNNSEITTSLLKVAKIFSLIYILLFLIVVVTISFLIINFK